MSDQNRDKEDKNDEERATPGSPDGSPALMTKGDVRELEIQRAKVLKLEQFLATDQRMRKEIELAKDEESKAKGYLEGRSAKVAHKMEKYEDFRKNYKFE